MGRGKRLLSALLAIGLLLCCWSALAEGGLQLAVEQYRIEMPAVNVYLYPTGADGQAVTDLSAADTKLSATLDGEQLTVRSLRPVGEQGTAYIFAVDVATNVDAYLLRNLKSSLLEWKKSLGANDRLLLITYGAGVNVVLGGDETEADAEAALEAIRQSEDGGLFKSAVSQAIALCGGKEVPLPERKVLIVTSDGKDVDTVENGAESLLLSLKDANLPLYALGMGTTKASLSTLSDLARKSGGTYGPIVAKDSAEQMRSLRAKLDCCYVLEAVAATNSIDPANRTLTLSIQSARGDATVSIPVTLKASAADHTPPKVTSVTTDGEGMQLTVAFSERVIGADRADHFDIQKNNGERIAIDKVTYEDGAMAATVFLQKKLYDGAYTLALSGVTDVSMEKNPLTAAFEFSVEDQGAGPILGGDTTDIPIWVWIAAGGGLLLVLGLMALLILKSQHKNKRVQQQELSKLQSGLNSMQSELGGQLESIKNRPVQAGVLGANIQVNGITGKRVEIRLAAANGVQRTMEAVVTEKPFLIGRTQAPGKPVCCDLAIEDKMISSAHCILRVQNGQLLIADNHSTNGTFVNGNRVFDVRPLHSGEPVMIGKTRLIFLFQ